MLDYVPAAVSILGGVFAFFFAKDGERNRVSGIGWFMAALLVAGGVLSLYVVYAKGKATEAAKLEAVKQAERAEIAAKIQSSMMLTLVGNFDPAQTIDNATLYFEFESLGEDRLEKPPAGFVGPFPKLPQGVSGSMFVDLGGDAQADFAFTTPDDRAIRLTDSSNNKTFVLNANMSEDWVRQDESTPEPPFWTSGIEPPSAAGPGGYSYAVTLPVKAQLRRLVYRLAVAKQFGHVRFERGRLSPAQLETIGTGLAELAPTLVFFVEGAAGEDPCDVYYRVPFRFVRQAAPLEWDSKQYDVFNLEMTTAGYFPETCENSPI